MPPKGLCFLGKEVSVALHYTYYLYSQRYYLYLSVDLVDLEGFEPPVTYLQSKCFAGLDYKPVR